jgi:hypothetical protein
MPRRILLVVILCLAICRTSFGWAYQGHILITRLAALRIINDPSAPEGLREFLKLNDPHTTADCQSLATKETVGPFPQNDPQYDRGLDHWCTMPDQVRILPEGRIKIPPYGQGEAPMHYLDLEAFAPTFVYKDDLSNKPDVNQIPHDLSDPRWKVGGYVPWRVEEMFHKFAADIGPGATVAKPQDALRAAGYLAHYVEDSTQPHHATVDYNSISYLAGHVAGIPVTTQPGSAVLAAMRLPRGINPHGDIEFRLFDDAEPPRDQYRQEYWDDLLADLDKFSKNDSVQMTPLAIEKFDPFRWDLHILADSYDFLPFVGHAAQAAYANGPFDAQAFFTYEGAAHEQEMSMIQVIALQNAKAVLHVERAYRLAWMEAHGPHAGAN